MKLCELSISHPALPASSATEQRQICPSSAGSKLRLKKPDSEDEANVDPAGLRGKCRENWLYWSFRLMAPTPQPLSARSPRDPSHQILGT